MATDQKDESTPLLDAVDPDSLDVTRSVSFDPQTAGLADSARSTWSQNSFSSNVWEKFTPSERESALRKDGVGSAAFLIRDAVLGEEDRAYETYYNPYECPEKEWRNFLAIICARLSANQWMVGLVQGTAWMLALLTFVEPPYWCRDSDLFLAQNSTVDGSGKFGSCRVLFNAKGESPDGETSVEYYPNSKAMVVSIEDARAVEWICLSVMTFYLILKFGRAGFESKRFFINGYRHGIWLLQICLMVFLLRSLLMQYTEYNPFVRLLLLGTLMRDFQREAYTLIKMLPQIFYILALLALLVVFYAWFGVVLFYGTDQGKRDFSNLIEGCWTLWICITTANYPDVMMPSYNENRLSAIFFVSFMIISFFFLMNLILATVVNEYDAAIEERKKSRKDLSYRNLTKAFHSMDPRGSGRIDRESIMALFLILNEDFPEFRTLSREETSLLFGFLDRDGSSTITLDEFQDFGSVLLLDFAKASEYTTFVETHFPKFYKSPGYQMFCDGVRSKHFEYAVDIILVLNAVVIGIQSYPELSGQPIEMDEHYSDGYVDTIWEFIETLFTIIYAVEVFIKVMVDGWKTYRESSRNMFDFFVTLLAILATAYVYYPNAYSDSRLIRFIVMVRVIRLLRILNAIKQFQLIGSISAEIMPAAASVIMFLFFLMYIFAAVGMMLYGGMITRDPSNPLSYAILGNDFSDNDYWANNFNDMLSGLNVLFNLLVVNNWTTCEIGFEAVTGGKMVRFFFLGFHILGVILVNNLVIAFIINAFFQQLETIYTRSSEAIVQGEAVIRGERAMFDASEVTGTKTGATGGYIARIRTVHRDVEVNEREGLRRLFTQQSSNESDKE